MLGNKGRGTLFYSNPATYSEYIINSVFTFFANRCNATFGCCTVSAVVIKRLELGTRGFQIEAVCMH